MNAGPLTATMSIDPSLLLSCFCQTPIIFCAVRQAISDDNTRRTRDLQRSRQLEGRLVVSPSQPSPAAVAPSAIEYPAQGLVSISPESTIGGPLTVELSLPQPAFEGAKLETAVEGDVMAAAHRTAKLAASGAGEGPGRVMGPSLDGVQTAVELLVQSHEAPLEADDGSEVMPRPEEVSSERRQPRQRGEITGHAATKLATPLTAVGEEEATLVDTATTAPPFATAASPSSSTAIPSAGKELPKDVGLPRPAPLADSGDNDVVGEAGFARSTPASTSSPPAYASDSRSPPGTWGSSTSLPGSAVGGPSSIDQELHDAPNSSKTKAVEEEEEQEEDEEQDEDEGEENGSITNSSGLENPALDNLFRVFLVFQEMRSRGVRPDLRAYNALVNTCAEVGDLDRALEVVRQMVDEDHGGGLQPDAVTYTSLIKAAARATPPRVEEAEEVFLGVGVGGFGGGGVQIIQRGCRAVRILCVCVRASARETERRRFVCLVYTRFTCRLPLALYLWIFLAKVCALLLKCPPSIFLLPPPPLPSLCQTLCDTKKRNHRRRRRHHHHHNRLHGRYLRRCSRGRTTSPPSRGPPRSPTHTSCEPPSRPASTGAR